MNQKVFRSVPKYSANDQEAEKQKRKTKPNSDES